MIEFRKCSDFSRGTLYDILVDAYSFDERNRKIWDADWKEADRFFYDNPEIADKYGLVTCLDGEPIGFVTWDPRHRPEYVEIGHNGIREAYKGRGYGRLQLEEALRRKKKYEGLKRIIVRTNSRLIASRNYESVGFALYDRKPNRTESAFAGDYPYYETMGSSGLTESRQSYIL
ncbi:MAG: GNAT family N-acetyltransferase [Clostridia bacterium]|nr:GNAT family N-acetyltransferase [Clostridia bacterium]